MKSPPITAAARYVIEVLVMIPKAGVLSLWYMALKKNTDAPQPWPMPFLSRDFSECFFLDSVAIPLFDSLAFSSLAAVLAVCSIADS